jgi:APA family basic amino acid/polyamine antiporter
VLTGIVSYKLLNVADPIAVGVNAMGEKLFWLRPVIKIAAIAGLSSVILVMMLGQPRIFYSMSRDGLLPPIFSKVHPKFKTPYAATIITGSFAMVLGGILPINILGELVSIGTLLAFAIVCIGIIVLRYKRPELERPFRTPWVPLIPALGASVCLLQMFSLPLATWLRLLVWMAVGLIIYFTYGIHHSKLRNSNKQ